MTTRDLVRIRDTGDLLSIRSLVEPSDAVDRDYIGDALWAERAAFSRAGTRPPLGQAGVPALMRVLPVVESALASASDQELAELGLPSGWLRSRAKDFRVEPERGGMLRMALPQGLIHRRWLMTAAGHVMRRLPDRRRMLRTLPERTVKALACSWFSAWPTGQLQWLSP